MARISSGVKENEQNTKTAEVPARNRAPLASPAEKRLRFQFAYEYRQPPQGVPRSDRGHHRGPVQPGIRHHGLRVPSARVVVRAEAGLLRGRDGSVPGEGMHERERSTPVPPRGHQSAVRGSRAAARLAKTASDVVEQLGYSAEEAIRYFQSSLQIGPSNVRLLAAGSTGPLPPHTCEKG